MGNKYQQVQMWGETGTLEREEEEASARFPFLKRHPNPDTETQRR